MPARSNINKFISKAKQIHGNKYVYDKFVYVNARTKGIITCDVHDDFEQTPDNHLHGQGCLKCSLIKAGENFRSNIEEFIQKARLTHGYKYNYDKFVYISCKANGIITCPEHGDFKQTPSSHLGGSGCLKCAGFLVSNLEEFVKQANQVHNNRYNYDKAAYINTETKCIITCPDHGDFKQTTNSHLCGHGCPKCVSKVSYIGSRWLDYIGIPNDPEHREVKKLISGRGFVADGYMPETNTVYEFYGDKVHGNPKLCSPNDKGPYGLTYGEAYQKTMKREEIFKAAGFNLVTIWESDYRKQLIQEFVENQSKKALKKAA